MKKLLFELPVFLNVVYLGILNLYVLDIFGNFESNTETIATIIASVMPSMITFTLFIIATRYNRIGALLFLVVAFTSVWFFKSDQDLNIFAVLSLPLFIITIGYYIRHFKPE